VAYNLALSLRRAEFVRRVEIVPRKPELSRLRETAAFVAAW
jgi:hypothetical protein